MREMGRGRLPVSVNVVVRAEAHRIEACLRRLRPHVDEIVVVDQDSSDGTVEATEGLADVVVRDRAWGRCEPSRSVAAGASRNDWVLVVDADEIVTDDVWSRAERFLRDWDVVHFVIANWVGDRFVQMDVMACPRLFRRDKVRFADELHGVVKPVPGARVRVEDGYVGFLHVKSVEEQQADWDRYARQTGTARRVWTDQSTFS